MFSDVNLVAVLVAGVVDMVIGALWYSPVLFAKSWMRLIGKKEEDMKKMNSRVMAQS